MSGIQGGSRLGAFFGGVPSSRGGSSSAPGFSVGSHLDHFAEIQLISERMKNTSMMSPTDFNRLSELARSSDELVRTSVAETLTQGLTQGKVPEQDGQKLLDRIATSTGPITQVLLGGLSQTV
ncbi:MAG: hypothetical protein AB7F28_01325 [Candidatus Margulisiibacteriota bacterium]